MSINHALMLNELKYVVFPLNWKMEIRIGIYYVLFPIKIKFCQDMQILLIVKRSLRFNNQTIMFQWIIYFNFMTLFDKNNECSFLLINHNSFISMKTKLWYDIITMMENTKKKKNFVSCACAHRNLFIQFTVGHLRWYCTQFWNLSNSRQMKECVTFRTLITFYLFQSDYQTIQYFNHVPSDVGSNDKYFPIL